MEPEAIARELAARRCVVLPEALESHLDEALSLDLARVRMREDQLLAHARQLASVCRRLTEHERNHER